MKPLLYRTNLSAFKLNKKRMNRSLRSSNRIRCVWSVSQSPPTFPSVFFLRGERPTWGKWNQTEEKSRTSISFSRVHSATDSGLFFSSILSFLLCAAALVVGHLLACARFVYEVFEEKKRCVKQSKSVFFSNTLQLTCTWWPRTRKSLPILPTSWRLSSRTVGTNQTPRAVTVEPVVFPV